jgi:hypothetical protein
VETFLSSDPAINQLSASAPFFCQSEDEFRMPDVHEGTDVVRLEGSVNVPIVGSDVGVPSDDQRSINFSDPSNHAKEEAKHDVVVLAVETKDESEPTEIFTHDPVKNTEFVPQYNEATSDDLVQEIPQGSIGVGTDPGDHQFSTSAESFSQVDGGNRSPGVDDGRVIIGLVGMTDPMGSFDGAKSSEEVSGDDRSCFTEFSDPFHHAALESKRDAGVSAVERIVQSKHSHPFPVKSDHGESHSSGVDEGSVVFRSLVSFLPSIR